MSDQLPSQHIWELMQEIGVAMVVTHTESGGVLRARPMAARPDSDDDAIYFLTDANTPKDQEIAHDSQVCLVFSDPRQKRWVSLTGSAEVFEDAETAERLWTEYDRAFWKNAKDPHIRVIRVTPAQGEYWEGPGFMANIVSFLTGGPSRDKKTLGENKKVAL